jgi:hypothetical protein
MRLWWRVATVLSSLWLLAAGGVHAQTLGDVAVETQDEDVVVRVTFNATIRFLQQSPPGPAEIYRVSFELVSGDESVFKQTTEESRRIASSGDVSEFRITYAPTQGRRMQSLTLAFRAATAVKVRQGSSSKSIELLFPGSARKSVASRPGMQAATPVAAAPVSDKRFAVRLQSVPANELDKLLPVPSRFDRYEVFAGNSMVDGVTTADVNIGYFATQEEADAVRRDALGRFPTATVVDTAKRREDVLRSVAAGSQSQLPPSTTEEPPATPGSPPAQQAVAPPAVAASAPVASPAVEARAAELMSKGREAIAAKRFESAVDQLNQLLLLPPNTLSQEAQELIGLAWERAGNEGRARVEYELYLKLFPEGEGAQRVSQRLASLEGAPPAPSATAASSPAPATKSAASGNRITGNIAQYYYGGKARSQSLVNIAAGIDQSTLTKTTESAIVTSVDLGGRYSTPESETRVVLRGTNSANLAADSHSASLLSAAYVDYKRTESGLAVRLGRQSSISGGLLGLFDGVSMTYPVSTGFKIDLMGGVPANPLISAPSERLLAAMVEADNILEHWGGDVYLIDQTTEGIANRRAFGTEVRYSGDLLSVYSLLDYDTLFRKINAVSLQGSFQAPGQTTITVLADSRKAPSLQMTNALISSGATSLKTLLQMQTLDQVRDAALATAASAKQVLLSVSRPLSEKWQFAVDLRYSEIGALPAVGNFEATPATGGQYGATLQLTGSNLYSTRDINNFNLSYLTTPFFKGTQVAYNNLTGLLDNDVTVEPSIRFYTQRDNQGVKLYRLAPGMRASYRFSRRASVLGEGIFEHSKTDGPLNHDTTNSIFFYLGYRYELF